MWSSSGGPALPCRRHDTLPAAPDWDSLLPLLPESVRLLAAYGGTCLYIPRCARLARHVRQRELLGAFSRHTAAGTSSNAEVRFLARRYGITDRRVWQLLKQEAELPAEVPEGPGAPLRS